MDSGPTTHVTTGDLHRQTDAIVDRAAGEHERVVVTREGEPIAALVPLEDLRLLEEIEDRIDGEAAERAYAEWKRSGEPAVPLEDILRLYKHEL